MGQGVWLAFAAVGALATGCATSTPAEGLDGPCTRTTDCQGGLVCGLKGYCTEPDASEEDVLPTLAAMDGGDAADAVAFDGATGG